MAFRTLGNIFGGLGGLGGMNFGGLGSSFLGRNTQQRYGGFGGQATLQPYQAMMQPQQSLPAQPTSYLPGAPSLQQAIQAIQNQPMPMPSGGSGYALPAATSSQWTPQMLDRDKAIQAIQNQPMPMPSGGLGFGLPAATSSQWTPEMLDRNRAVQAMNAAEQAARNEYDRMVSAKLAEFGSNIPWGDPRVRAILQMPRPQPERLSGYAGTVQQEIEAQRADLKRRQEEQFMRSGVLDRAPSSIGTSGLVSAPSVLERSAYNNSVPAGYGLESTPFSTNAAIRRRQIAEQKAKYNANLISRGLNPADYPYEKTMNVQR